MPYAIIIPQRVSAENKLETTQTNYETVSVKTFDSIHLKGYHLKSLIDTTYASLVFVHGIGGCKEHFTGLALKLAALGYDSFMFDNRAHGQSEGLYTTYGFHEKKDIAYIVKYIKSIHKDKLVGIWGNSLGGAIALQALAYDKAIDFGIVESTFTDLKQIVYDYQKQKTYGIPLRLACNIALKEAGTIANFNPDDVKPIDDVKQISQPVLIAHGDKDKNIDVSYGKAFYKALASKDKELIIIENGEHFGLAETGGQDYWNRLIEFIRIHSKN